MENCILNVEKNNCSGCYACANICPVSAIAMVADEEGFVYPKIDGGKCISCHLCEKTCPAMHWEEGQNIIESYAASAKDSHIRECSSSGGVFTLLATNIIKRKGVVFGVVFDSDFKGVHHRSVNIEATLKLLQGSKYVQSKVEQTYREVRELLNADRWVMYCGTPCQIAGLRAFLSRKYDKLITLDFICHGVPSPLVWQKYVEYHEQRSGAGIEEAFFRNKKFGWKLYSLLLKFKNGKIYSKLLNEDWFMRGFLADYYLRPSCYNCHFRGKKRNSDITLADFWGVENVFPDLNDDAGISLITVNTLKGKEEFEAIKEHIVTKACSLNVAEKYNSALVKSPVIPAQRALFWGDWEVLPFEKTLKKYCRVPLKIKIRKQIKKMIYSILRKNR